MRCERSHPSRTNTRMRCYLRDYEGPCAPSLAPTRSSFREFAAREAAEHPHEARQASPEALLVPPVEVEIPKDYYPDVSHRHLWMLAPEVDTSMESLEEFIKYVHWTPAEKKVARRAFDEALGRHLQRSLRRLNVGWRTRWILLISGSWKLTSRKAGKPSIEFINIDIRTCSELFSILMRDGWLKDADLVGLQPGHQRHRRGLTQDV